MQPSSFQMENLSSPLTSTKPLDSSRATPTFTNKRKGNPKFEISPTNNNSFTPTLLG